MRGGDRPAAGGYSAGYRFALELGMISIQGAGSRLCDGLSRRDLLKLGSLGFFNLSLPGLLAGRARAAGSSLPRAKARSCILLFLWGGPAQQETWDLKPGAPQAARGEFKPIATNVSGISICEHLPLLARQADKYAILRSVTHPGVNHGTSAYHMLTGHMHKSPGTLRHPAPDDMPSLGSAVARFHPRETDLPRFVALPAVIKDGDGGDVPGQGAGVLGASCDPFLVNGDLTRPTFSIPILTLPADVAAPRLGRRAELHALIDRHAEHLGRTAAGWTLGAHYDRAVRLLSSSAAARAFDLASEPTKLRDRYGRHNFAQSLILARRLVEAGVPLVTAYWNSPSNTDNQSWDTHTDSFNRLKNHMLPPFDRALSAFLEDLSQRGLLDETLVAVMGEFGRTPKLNKAAGRDHWGFCQSVLMAGGGVRGGVVHSLRDSSASAAKIGSR